MSRKRDVEVYLKNAKNSIIYHLENVLGYEKLYGVFDEATYQEYMNMAQDFSDILYPYKEVTQLLEKDLNDDEFDQQLFNIGLIYVKDVLKNVLRIVSEDTHLSTRIIIYSDGTLQIIMK